MCSLTPKISWITTIAAVASSGRTSYESNEWPSAAVSFVMTPRMARKPWPCHTGPMPGHVLRTQLAIIAAGPAGSLLSIMLHRAGVESVVVERQSRDHVLSRIRAGVLEWGSVELLRETGLGARMDVEGRVHLETGLAYGGEHLFYFGKHSNSRFMAYGQTMIQEDLYTAADAAGLEFTFEVDDVTLHDVTTARPSLTFTQGGAHKQIESDFVVGCDGFHGPAKGAIPPSVLRTYEKAYPFGWLGIMSETPPLEHLVYCNS